MEIAFRSLNRKHVCMHSCEGGVYSNHQDSVVCSTHANQQSRVEYVTIEAYPAQRGEGVCVKLVKPPQNL